MVNTIGTVTADDGSRLRYELKDRRRSRRLILGHRQHSHAPLRAGPPSSSAGSGRQGEKERAREDIPEIKCQPLPDSVLAAYCGQAVGLS